MAQCENVFAALWLPIHLMDGLTAAGCADRTDTTSMASLVSRFEDDATRFGRSSVRSGPKCNGENKYMAKFSDE